MKFLFENNFKLKVTSTGAYFTLFVIILLILLY